MPSTVQVLLLAIVQGLAELLPVSSSAHVIVAEKLMGLNPSAPDMTLLLVMLHTGTMFAVIVYFWKRWKALYFSSFAMLKSVGILVFFATATTGAVGGILIKVVEKIASAPNAPKAEIEQLFSRLDLIAPALALAGILILISGLTGKRGVEPAPSSGPGLDVIQAVHIGAVQGFCLPFRGFSRSGATISAAMIAHVGKDAAENFSFALAVVLTPAVIVREALRLAKSAPASLHNVAVPCLLGVVFAFLAGLVALKWLSKWLESGQWWIFGVYCLAAATGVWMLHLAGY